MKIKTLLVALALGILSGCATQSMLPSKASEVDFSGPEGKTDWSKYEHEETFRGYTPDQIYAAAKVGLGESGFSIVRADKNDGVLIGEHGITLHDWNVLAGVYLKEVQAGTSVKVIAQGSKDIGFSGDVTGDGWTGKILGSMRRYLNETYQSILKVDRRDIKVNN